MMQVPGSTTFAVCGRCRHGLTVKRRKSKTCLLVVALRVVSKEGIAIVVAEHDGERLAGGRRRVRGRTNLTEGKRGQATPAPMVPSLQASYRGI